MSLPGQSVTETKLLVFLSKYREPVETRQVYGPLANAIRLTRYQRTVSIKTASGVESAWENLVRFARRRLVDNRLMFGTETVGRGQWSLTATGREEANRLIELEDFREKVRTGVISVDDLL